MDIALALSRKSPMTLGVQVAEGIRKLVQDGLIAPGEPLPSTRELARSLGIGRNTVIAAYEQLADSGHLALAPRRRPMVNPDLTRPAPSPRRQDVPPAPRPLPGQIMADRLGPSYDLGPETRWDFRLGTPAVESFPERSWLRVYRRALSAQNLLYSHDPRGSMHLRTAVAARLLRSRGITATPEQIVITTGTQQAVAAIARFVLTSDDAVLMEEPGYLTARRLFLSLGARVRPAPVDEQGLLTDKLPSGRLAYVTPSHQFPLGGVLPLPRRQQLLAWAVRHDAFLIEDDYDGEFRFGLPPLPALQGLDRNGRTFYVGTFSKVLAPGLRLGFIVAPETLAPALAEFRALTERPPDGVSQEALAAFITEGSFEAHLRRMRKLYAERRRLVDTVLTERLPPGWHITGAPAGLHVPIVCTTPSAPDLEALSRQWQSQGLLVETLAPYSMARRPPAGLVLNYGALPPNELERGLLALCEVLQASYPRHARSTPGER